MSSFKSLTLFQKGDELSNVSKLFIVLNDIFEMIRVNDDIQSAKLGCSKLFGSYTGKANGFPNFWNIRFFGCIIGLNVLLVHDVDLGELLIVAKLGE